MQSRSLVGDAVNQVIYDQTNNIAYKLNFIKNEQQVSFAGITQAMQNVVKTLTEEEVEALSELYALSCHGAQLDFTKKGIKIRFTDFLTGYFLGRFFANTKALMKRESMNDESANEEG
jgi:hypothetical protein